MQFTRSILDSLTITFSCSSILRCDAYKIFLCFAKQHNKTVQLEIPFSMRETDLNYRRALLELNILDEIHRRDIRQARFARNLASIRARVRLRRSHRGPRARSQSGRSPQLIWLRTQQTMGAREKGSYFQAGGCGYHAQLLAEVDVGVPRRKRTTDP